MFKNTYQSGFLSILYAGGSRPLGIWGQSVKNGHIRRVTDEDVQTLALEIMGTNVATTYIKCPSEKNGTLGIRLPFFIMIVKNMKKYFTFEITILDDKNMSRRFRVSNYQSTTRVRPFSTSLPIGLTGGWNQIQFNLADFTRRAYGSSYLETLRVQIHANVRIRRIYFSDRLYGEDELPHEFKLYIPISKQKKGKVKKEDKSTGADKIRKSLEPPPEVAEELFAAPPTPTEGDMVGGIEAGIAAPTEATEEEEGLEVEAALDVEAVPGEEEEDMGEGEEETEAAPTMVTEDVEGAEDEDAGEGAAVEPTEVADAGAGEAEDAGMSEGEDAAEEPVPPADEAEPPPEE